ncbi:MAG: AMP-binding protein, partial [Gemmatimonadaceae bacterium]|nr:AMP-binding protein [Gemmatimonadaceae bacterium]
MSAVSSPWDAPFGDPIARWAVLTPEAAAVRDAATSTTVSYAALDRLATRWQRFLETQGVARGTRVGILAPNSLAHVAAYVACGRIGAALVPLNWRLAAPELAEIVHDAALALLLVDDPASVPPAASSVRVVPLADVVLPAADAPPQVDVHLDPRDVAMVLYTSGSTGRPKGALLTHGMVLANAIATVAAWQLSHTDVAPIATPFFHTGAWHVFTTPLWWIGGSIVLFESFDAAVWLDAVAANACTVAFAVPTQLAMLRDSAAWGRPLPALQWLIVG